MAIHYPPHYRYPLLDPWDKKAFNMIKRIAQTKNYPKILGTEADKNQFLITLIRTQKSLHGWSEFLVDVLEQVENSGKIDIEKLNKEYPSSTISTEVPVWVTYSEDKIVSDFIDELATRKIDFQGSDKEIAEFIMRFILGQLGNDWEQTIIMIWELLGDESTLKVSELNREMRNFDYLKLFED